MTRPRALICFVVLSTLGCAGVPALSLGNTPDKVADAYLHAALQDPLDPAREYVSLRCIDRPVWNGSPVRVLGQARRWRGRPVCRWLYPRLPWFHVGW